MARTKPIKPSRLGQAGIRASRKKPAPPADTREGLIAELNKLLDAADEAIAQQRAAEVPMKIWWTNPSGRLGVIKDRIGGLVTRMALVLGQNSGENPRDVFSSGVAAPANTVPSYARPGVFLQWTGFVPVLVCWHGLLGVSVSMETAAADPDELWLNDSGYRWINPQQIDGKRSLVSMVRDRIMQETSASDFKFVPLTAYAKQQARERLVDYPWLAAALKAGPVDPIPLPKRMQAVQRSLL